jgi:hypothetical protein
MQFSSFCCRSLSRYKKGSHGAEHKHTVARQKKYTTTKKFTAFRKLLEITLSRGRKHGVQSERLPPRIITRNLLRNEPIRVGRRCVVRRPGQVVAGAAWVVARAAWVVARAAWVQGWQ